jgi:hypothetical protein
MPLIHNRYTASFFNNEHRAVTFVTISCEEKPEPYHLHAFKRGADQWIWISEKYKCGAIRLRGL